MFWWSTTVRPMRPPNARAKAARKSLFIRRIAAKAKRSRPGLRHWLDAARLSYVVILDADGQHPPEEIDALSRRPLRRRDAELLIGTRMNDVRSMPLVRR